MSKKEILQHAEETIHLLEKQVIDISNWSIDPKIKRFFLQRLNNSLEDSEIIKLILQIIGTHITEAEYLRIFDLLNKIDKKTGFKI